MERIEQNFEYIDIVFSDALYSCLRISLGNKLYILSCNLSYNLGDISNMLDFNSRYNEYLAMNYYFEKPKECVFQHIGHDNLKSLFNDKRKIRIWSGKRYSDELCGLYFMCSLFKDRDLYLVDIPNCDDDPHYDSIAFADSLLSVNDISYNLLSHDEKQNYSLLWEELVAENADLRINGNNRIHVISTNYESFYKDVLQLFDGSKQMSTNELTRKFIDENSDTIISTQAELIIKHMIDSGALKITKTIIKNSYYGINDIYVKPIKQKGIIDYFFNNEVPTYKFTKYDLDDKRRLIDYLKQGEVILAAACTIKDQITKNAVLNIELDIYLIGSYTYSSEEIYHIEKYDALITKDFNQYLINKGVLKKVYRKKRA